MKSLWNRSWNMGVTFLIAWPEQVSVWDKWRFTGSKETIFSQVEWVCTCSGIDSSPWTLTCEEMFQHPKAKAVMGPQTTNTGQQVLLRCVHLTETLISLLLMIFPKKLETSPVHLCGIESPGHDNWTIPRKRLCSHRRNRDLHTKRPRPSHF